MTDFEFLDSVQEALGYVSLTTDLKNEILELKQAGKTVLEAVKIIEQRLSARKKQHESLVFSQEKDEERRASQPSPFSKGSSL